MKLARKLAIASVVAFTALGAINAHAANVLVVLSDADHMDLQHGKTYPTGFFINELMQPVEAFTKDGDTITFATPNGEAPSLDQNSATKDFFGGDAAALQRAQTELAALKLTSRTESPVISLSRVAQIGYDHYDAIYVPGGHAPMQDLISNPDMGKLLAYFHAHNKITALDCHAPIALLSTMPHVDRFVAELAATGKATPSPGWIYANYHVTVFANSEEAVATKYYLKGNQMKFWPQNALTAAGANVSVKDPAFTPQIVTDRELITGQNPASAPLVAAEIIKRMK